MITKNKLSFMMDTKFSQHMIPEIHNPDLFDMNDLLLIDQAQDKNLDAIGEILKDRKQAIDNGVQIISVPELDEAKVMYFQQHEHYLACLEAMKEVANKVLSGSDPTVVAFKQANDDLEKAFLRYENALKRSYQN